MKAVEGGWEGNVRHDVDEVSEAGHRFLTDVLRLEDAVVDDIEHDLDASFDHVLGPQIPIPGLTTDVSGGNRELVPIPTDLLLRATGSIKSAALYGVRRSHLGRNRVDVAGHSQVLVEGRLSAHRRPVDTELVWPDDAIKVGSQLG